MRSLFATLPGPGLARRGFVGRRRFLPSISIDFLRVIEFVATAGYVYLFSRFRATQGDLAGIVFQWFYQDHAIWPLKQFEASRTKIKVALHFQVGARDTPLP